MILDIVCLARPVRPCSCVCVVPILFLSFSLSLTSFCMPACRLPACLFAPFYVFFFLHLHFCMRVLYSSVFPILPLIYWRENHCVLYAYILPSTYATMSDLCSILLPKINNVAMAAFFFSILPILSIYGFRTDGSSDRGSTFPPL